MNGNTLNRRNWAYGAQPKVKQDSASGEMVVQAMKPATIHEAPGYILDAGVILPRLTCAASWTYGLSRMTGC